MAATKKRTESDIISRTRTQPGVRRIRTLDQYKLFKNFASAVAFKQLLNETSRLRAVVVPIR